MILNLYKSYCERIYPKATNIRGFTRIKLILREFALRNVGKVESDDEETIFESEWDNLIIIDACRQDFFEEITGLGGSRISKGSATPEYIEKTFSEGSYDDYVYVAANPMFSDWKFKQLTGREPKKVFHTVFKTFNTSWDEEENTVLPEDTVEDALTASKLFPDKNLIIHFLPPHYPFIGKSLKGELSPSLGKGQDTNIWSLAEKGKVEQEAVKEGYKDNIELVYSYVQDLAQDLEGKTVLTSDHGNFVDENGVYGHPRERDEKPLRQVPFIEL